MVDEDIFEQQRKNMVEEQLITRGIEDKKVLEAFLSVPREKFLPDSLKKNAYEDRPLPIKEGQTISQPFIVAQMVEALKPDSEDKMLEIGTGSGYATAILSRIVSEVHSIERYEILAEDAKNRFKILDYNNIQVHTGDGTTGLEEDAPYDGIMVSAAAPDISEVLIAQLKIDGYLVIPAGSKTIQDLFQVQKISKDKVKKINLGKVRFVPLIGKAGWAH